MVKTNVIAESCVRQMLLQQKYKSLNKKNGNIYFNLLLILRYRAVSEQMESVSGKKERA